MFEVVGVEDKFHLAKNSIYFDKSPPKRPGCIDLRLADQVVGHPEVGVFAAVGHDFTVHAMDRRIALFMSVPPVRSVGAGSPGRCLRTAGALVLVDAEQTVRLDFTRVK
jgi:hypothetical protein